MERRATSDQFLTRRGDGEERGKDDVFRGQKEEDTVSNWLSEKSSSIDRSTSAALQTGMIQSSAGTAKKVTAARIDLTDTSSLPRAPRINSQPGVKNLTSIPREYAVTERVVSPAANKEPPLQPSRKPKLDTKSSGHIPLSFSSKNSTPTAKESPENLLNMSKPAFDSEAKRSQGLSPQTTVSPKVLIRPSRPYEVASWSKHPEKALPKEALPLKASLEKERPLRDILLPKVRAKIDKGVNKASISDSADGTRAQAIQAALLSLRAKADTDEEKPLATFDPVAFDSIIYRQSRLRPPPGVRLSSRIVKNGSASRKSERVYLPVNPAIHKMHKRSQHWHKQKCEEIKRRPSRKAWFGKVEARLRWLRAEEERLEQSRQNAQDDGTMPPFEPPEPRCFKQILDFGDVPEKELPEHVRNDPAWLKACAWLRKCEDQATHQRQQVEGTAGENETSLVLGDSMLGRDEDLLARGLGDTQLNIALAAVLEHLVKTDSGDLVTSCDLVVVSLVLESQGDNTLLLEVGLVDTGKRLGQDNAGTEVARLESSVLTGRALAIVVLGDNQPLLATILPELTKLGNGVLGAIKVVSGVDFASLFVDSGVKSVGADVGQMTLVLEPGAGGRDSDAQLGVARLEGGLRALETVRGGELEVLAVRGLDAVGHRVEGGRSSESHGSNNLGGREEVHGIRVTIVTTTEVSIVRGQDSVAGALLNTILSLPLTNTGTTCVGKNDTAGLLESLKGAVSLESSANLFTSRGDVEVSSGLEASLLGILEQTLDSGHILIGTVSAATNETSREEFRPFLLLDNLLELGEGCGQIRSERSVDVRLEGGEINGDEVVVLGTLIGLELPSGIGVRAVAGKALESLDVLVGLRSSSRVKYKKQGLDRSAFNLPHVADGSHAGGAEAIDALAKVLNDGACTATNSKVASETKNNVLRRSPVAQLANKVHTENLGGLEFPRSTNKRLDSISTADTNSDCRKTTGVGTVRVGSKHHQSRKSVVLENSLMNNSSARRPEVHSVFASSRLKEVKHLLVGLNTSRQIILSTLGSHNQVITVNACGDSRLGEVARHELEDGHLSRSILHVHTVGVETQVSLATDVLSIFGVAKQRLLGVVEMAVEDLLGKCKTLLAQYTTNISVLGVKLLVGRRKRLDGREVPP
ncbi:hypothetical protein HG531_007814 [Fusarium graminearum]|nr:hypothetical protein HG531_007814 [Fusarium graminearum]